MSVTAELLDRLRRHYLRPGDGPAGGVFVPEVGLNGSEEQRRCDAVYVGFTATSGQLMVGHELKVARADWRHELDQPDKADAWARQCHAWYVVAPSPSVVPPEELPPGWGLMLPNRRSTVRMSIAVPAAVKPPTHRPSWLAVRSLLARLDTLQRQDRRDTRTALQTEIHVGYADRLAALADGATGIGDRRLVDELEEELGVRLRPGGGSWDERVTPDLLAEALTIARTRRQVTRAWCGLAAQADALEQTAQQLRRLDADLAHVPSTSAEDVDGSRSAPAASREVA